VSAYSNSETPNVSASATIRIAAPGSIMLMGEHAVLRGAKALACAVDKYMHLTLLPRHDRQVIIHSALAEYRANLDHLTDEPALSFVLTALRQWQPKLPAGFELSIESEFSHTLGLGSSAAVVAALTCALDRYAATGLTPAQLFDAALAVIHTVQNGRGSGTDLAASLYGGLIAYRAAPRELSPLSGAPDIALWYVGYKMKTPDVLALVERQSRHAPQLYAQLDTLMAQTSEQAEQAVAVGNWAQLGRLMNIYQGLMDALGVNDGALSAIIYALRSQSGVLGSKISGSGLGDCVVALGEAGTFAGLADTAVPGQRIDVGLSAHGAIHGVLQSGRR